MTRKKRFQLSKLGREELSQHFSIEDELKNCQRKPSQVQGFNSAEFTEDLHGKTVEEVRHWIFCDLINYFKSGFDQFELQ